MTGPAVADAHDTFLRHWNAAAKPIDQVKPIDRPPEQTDSNGLDGLSSAQVVRTINSGMFADLPDGEQGVLEPYLRAISASVVQGYGAGESDRGTRPFGGSTRPEPCRGDL